MKYINQVSIVMCLLTVLEFVTILFWSTYFSSSMCNCSMLLSCLGFGYCSEHSFEFTTQ